MAATPIDPIVDSVDLGALPELVGYHLRRASGAFAGDFTRSMAGTGMRQVLFGILTVVGANAGINQGSVARNLGIQRANMVSLINELVDGGLVERRVSSEDRRAFALMLSPAGRSVLDDCMDRVQAHERAMLADLDADEQAQLIVLLMKVERQERP